MSNRTLAIWLGYATAVVLIGMVVLSMATGATQERHEHYALSENYAIGLLSEARPLRALFALDIAFLILYTAFFAALASYLRALGRPFVMLALGAMIGTAVLDIIEDHHIVTMLDAAEHAVLPSQAEIAFQVTLSATKFSLSYLSLVMFGLAIPRDRKLGVALAIFLVAGTLVNAVIGYALPATAQASFDSGRWVGFLLGFGLAIAWLRGAPEPEAAKSAATTAV